MATYKVWLTVKDNYGNTKEVDGGTINVDLAEMSTTEVSQMAKQLDPFFTTDAEVAHVVDTKDAIKYSDFDLKPKN
jgi:hypothetical protein